MASLGVSLRSRRKLHARRKIRAADIDSGRWATPTQSQASVALPQHQRISASLTLTRGCRFYLLWRDGVRDPEAVALT